MTTHRHDAAFAGVALVILTATGVWLFGGDPFWRPRAVVLGVGGALLVESAFLRYPERLLALWELPGVAPLAAGAVVALGVAAATTAPWILAALCWGLGTYFGLLACLLAGFGNPVGVVLDDE